MKQVVITGLGVVSSLGCSLDSVTDALRNGRSGFAASPDMLAAGRESRLERGVDHTVEDIAVAAEGGDALAVEVLAETGRYLGVGLANFANLFNPERIVVTGGVSRAGEAILGPAEEEMRRRAFRAITEPLKVVPGQLGDDAGPLGAVYPLIQRRD